MHSVLHGGVLTKVPRDTWDTALVFTATEVIFYKYMLASSEAHLQMAANLKSLHISDS